MGEPQYNVNAYRQRHDGNQQEDLIGAEPDHAQYHDQDPGACHPHESKHVGGGDDATDRSLGGTVLDRCRERYVKDPGEESQTKSCAG